MRKKLEKVFLALETQLKVTFILERFIGAVRKRTTPSPSKELPTVILGFLDSMRNLPGQVSLSSPAPFLNYVQKEFFFKFVLLKIWTFPWVYDMCSAM